MNLRARLTLASGLLARPAAIGETDPISRPIQLEAVLAAVLDAARLVLRARLILWQFDRVAIKRLFGKATVVLLCAM